MIDTLEDTLETSALTEGTNRYFKKLETSTKRKAPLDRSDIRNLLVIALPLVSELLKAKLQAAASTGRPSKAVEVISLLDPDLTALVGLSSCFRVISQHKPLVSICYNIGYAIDDELWAARLYEKDPKLAKRIVNKAVRNHGNIAYRRKAVRHIAKVEGHVTSIIPEDEKVLVGGYVLDCILQAVPEVFQTYVVRGKNTTQNYVGLSPEAADEIAKAQELQAWMHPAYKPMVVPPKPWVDFHTGCYHNAKVARSVTLVRTKNKQHIALIQSAIKEGTMTYCLEALNAIQATRWKVNQPLLDLVAWAYEENKHLASFPARRHLEPPPRPANFDDLPEPRKKGWRITAARVHQRNRGIDGERLTMLQDITTATELAAAACFYIPHNMDFRGRVYPVPHFNQQRADHVKAMMHFAEGKVLTDSGAYWLAVHLANCGDFEKISKQPFDTRAQWVVDNEELIFKVAQDPKGTFDIWSQADKPFSFVAACLEWRGYRTDPANFRSHIAVALDGSNSGLQHYSCMMRSEREGALVNLVPTDVPADLYQTVADRVRSLVEQDVEKGLEVAKVVLKAGVTRKLCKRATMTFAYSSEEYGFRQQLMSDFMDPASVDVLTGKLDKHPWEMLKVDKETGEEKMDGGFTAAAYIAKLIWKAVNEIVTDASKGMAFFRRCAQLLAHESKGLVWVTPVGLPVLHLYPEYKAKKLKIFLHDREVRLFSRTEALSVVNKAKAADAVAPNVVHSMDSAALMLCVLDCTEAGVVDFSLIHDSFGAHANDTETMYMAVRQSLISMYQNYCPFTEIWSQTHASIDAKEKVPAIPSKGGLDLKLILDAPYAFA